MSACFSLSVQPLAESVADIFLVLEEVRVVALNEVVADLQGQILHPADHGLLAVQHQLDAGERGGVDELGADGLEPLAEFVALVGGEQGGVLGVEGLRVAADEDEVLDHVLEAQRVHVDGREAGGDRKAEAEVAAEERDLRGDVDDDVVVEHEHLPDPPVGVQELLHRGLVELVAALDARVERPAVGRAGERPALGVDVGRSIEVGGARGRLAADLRADGVVVHERRMRPGAEQRDVAVVAATAVLQHLGAERIGRAGLLGQRGVFRPDAARHVVGVERTARVGADLRRGRDLVVAEPVEAEGGVGSDRWR